jgi:hypothetical protein
MNFYKHLTEMWISEKTSQSDDLTRLNNVNHIDGTVRYVSIDQNNFLDYFRSNAASVGQIWYQKASSVRKI